MAYTENYSALVAVSQQEGTEASRIALKQYLKKHEIKNSKMGKFVVKDDHSRRILGLGKQKEGVYLLVADSKNIK